ncbi:MAG: single-stranded-DNA-specific exonuclease RecJ [Candidatus Hodarchaeota archaeon]
MPVLNTRWKLKRSDVSATVINRLSNELSISPITARILTVRGYEDIDEAQEFLNPSYKHSYDPFLMRDLEEAVQRLKETFQASEPILVHGDYDVDGITSTALIFKAFSSAYPVETYLPDRFEEGYGMSKNAIDFAKEKKIPLILTVDCGVSALEEAKYAEEQGIDLIITDHHQVKESDLQTLQKNSAVHAIVDIHRSDCFYPFKHLTGAGIAFKLVQALINKGALDVPLRDLIELCAIGTVADVAEITGENRFLVKKGLELLARTENPGLRALKIVCGLEEGKQLHPSDIGFKVGPRLNASGRLGSANDALQLLLTQDPGEAQQLALKLDEINQERQALQDDIYQQAINKIEKGKIPHLSPKAPFLVVDGKDWHEGVVGIVASKVQERYYRPTVVISIDEEAARGSGRSITDFNLLEALLSCEDLFDELGGHPAAAGFSIAPENIPKLRERINKYAKQALSKEDLVPQISVDAELRNLEAITERLVNEIDAMTPFGLGNPRPQLIIKNLVLRDWRFVGRTKEHVKMVLGDDRGKQINAIAFRAAEKMQTIHSNRIDVVCTPSINEWQGRREVQLQIKDFR